MGGCVWLDSAQQSEALGRYSYMAALPFSTLRIDKPTASAVDQLTHLSHSFHTAKVPELPPMQGGWMGWFGYEMGNCFESVPTAKYNEFQLPIANLGLYDVVLSWDHLTGQSWIVSQGWPVLNPAKRQSHAYRRLRKFTQILENAPAPHSEFTHAQRQFRLPAHRLAPQFSTRWSPQWTSNFSSAEYRAAVQRCVEYIYAGDVFQVNLSQRLVRQATCPPEELYLHLRQANPAPFAGYTDFGRTQLLSCSPERFLSLNERVIETRPIKGTRPRLSNPLADAGIGELLQASEKDRSENVMIVDLMRNDLSRVATSDSVKVTSLCGLEKYPFVWHLVSVIQAQLASHRDASDVLHATFPGGSITGAPKIRAMEIIAELEPTVRGPYCGSLGYISFAGDMDLSILIRTISACDGWWQAPVGGGIVAASKPDLEEQETWHKAEGIMRAIDSLPTASR
ncbi:Aminodeoxychorismate synthase component 1 [Aureliella helgolandensis]|uniref:aminodeoxychorismate synthase n=2 Tax=Aureliella helgolandensis TaxID=2527968 RepID=A0A518G6M1_9BACT|nr:Aminodeoxychorismate synthase component 1 [Aureliella helgolandensis]